MPEPAVDPRLSALYQDCRDLARYIARTRAEIATLRPRHLASERLPRAGQELDAVVKETEDATHTIMTAAEGLLGWSGTANELGNAIESACLKIFEACAFQDITGQRVRKVVQTIHHIEERLDQLMRLLGPEVGDNPPEDRVGDAKLLNGPQLAGQGIDQDAIDRLIGDAPAAQAPAAPAPGPDGADAARPAAAKAEPRPAPKAEVPTGATSSQADIDALFD